MRKSVFKTVGIILIILGLSMLISCLWEFSYRDLKYNALESLLLSSFITVLSGTLLFILCYKSKISDISLRDGFSIVTIGWILMAVFSALPLYIADLGFSYTESFFEAMSGLTTSGSSIIENIDIIPESLLFWRSFMHFIGGMGIIVFSLAMLPLLGFGGVQLFRAEVAGPSADKLTPRVKQTAKLLWSIYISFILILTVMLYAQGMTLHQAICHSFGTIATAGFSTESDSINAFSISIKWTIIFFMILSATNFSFHYYFISKGKFEYFKDIEFKVYIFIIIACASIFYINISSSIPQSTYVDIEVIADISASSESIIEKNNLTDQKQIKNPITDSVFTSVALLTTTGFRTADFEQWPGLSKVLIFVLFFIGGCAGSTTGGMKIIRSILVWKYLVSEVRKLIHPNGVFPVKVGNKTISDDVVKSTLGYYLFYILIFFMSAIIISATGQDFETSITAAAVSIGNIGPGLGSIGPADTWAQLHPIALWVSSFCMLLGRLEIFTVMVLFSRTFWRK